MSVKLRFARAGRKKTPFYHIVAADSRNARDGRYIERVGYFNPFEKTTPLVWDTARVEHWLSVGAEPSDRVSKILIAEKVGTEKLRAKLEGKLNYKAKKVQERLAKEKAAKEAEAAAEAAAAAPAEEAPVEAPAEEAPVEAAAAEEATPEAAPAAEEASADAEKPAE